MVFHSIFPCLSWPLRLSKALFLVVMGLGFSTILMAQTGLPSIAGARGAAMGNATVGFQDINSIFANQAGLAHLEQTAFTAIGENRFQGFGIRSVAAAAAVPVKTGTFGLALQYFGIEEYNEQKVGLAYARKLSKKLSLGAQIDFLRLQIQDSESINLVTFEAGLQSQISRKLNLGFYLYSPVQITIFGEDTLPTTLKLGGLYRVSKKLRLAMEFEKDLDFPVEFHLGMEYQIIEELALRLGAQTQPSEVSIGFGYLVQQQVQLDVAATYHEILGITPSFSAIYLWNKK